ncbi:MAG TPA: hypothetical protein VKC17_04370, partial [Sphingomicrobium sp.]|nr:hypothetical protein [Sphingomicrobium sp.]
VRFPPIADITAEPSPLSEKVQSPLDLTICQNSHLRRVEPNPALLVGTKVEAAVYPHGLRLHFVAKPSEMLFSASQEIDD